MVRKSGLIYALLGVFLVLVITLVSYLYVSGNSFNDRISVVGFEGDMPFSYELKNKQILMTGTTYEFKTQKSKVEVFKGLSESFPVFKETDDRIQIIAQNQVFTLKYLEKDRFILYDEMIVFETKEAIFSIPFPTDQLENEDKNRFTSSFIINCDINYLKKFYSDYKNINVENQKVIIRDAVYSSITQENSSASKTITLEIKGKEVFVHVS